MGLHWKFLTALAFAFAIVALELFFDSNSLIKSVKAMDGYPDIAIPYNVDPTDLDALEELWSEWNKNTPNFNANFPGWSSSSNVTAVDPCGHNTGKPWGGIVCSQVSLNGSEYAFVVSLTLSDKGIVGTLPAAIKKLGNLQYLKLSGNPNLTGTVPSDLVTKLHQLNYLDLSNNSFSGPIPNLTSCKALTQVKFSMNKFNGTLHLDGFRTEPGNLWDLIVDYNNITDVVYTRNITSLYGGRVSLRGNPFCQSSKANNSALEELLCRHWYDSDDTSKQKLMVIGISVTSCGITLILVTLILASIFWRTHRDKKLLLLEVHKKFAEYDLKPTLFTYNELQKATQDFNSNLKLGEGGYGVVYKGNLAGGSQVAVKQLFSNPSQKIDEFLNEVILLTSVQHKNLVKLQGCCLHRGRRLLVYKYIEKNDLAQILFDQNGRRMLTWPIRLNICQGVAQGLHYIHALVKPKIIHRDIKASNILLDKTFQPLIADFGVALLFPNEETHIMTMHIAGTKGYLAPEYATTGQLSEKIDVYSFGVLVLELISGRMNLDTDMAMEKVYLPAWALDLKVKDKLMDLVDPTLQLSIAEEGEAIRVIKIALRCLQMVGDKRPSMAQVIAMLQGDMKVLVGE